MAISLTKTIPSSTRYTGSGAITVTLTGAEQMEFGAKNDLLKINIPQSKATWTANASDLGKNYTIDLKRITDTMTIKGWLDDDSTETAWNKAWKLRAMATCGGPLTTLIIENLTFQTGADNITAFLETVNFTVKPNYEQTINTTSGDSARIEVTLQFVLGTQR